MKYWFLVALLALSLVLSACGSTALPAADEGATAAGGDLTVFAAASLTEAFTQLGQAFEAANPDTTVTFNFAGSQQLASQLAQGAPADVFASANIRQMEGAMVAGRVVSGTQQVFARNRLVVVVPGDNPGAVATLQDLVQPGLRLVLAAEDVPVGAYTRDYLAKAEEKSEFEHGYREAVLANVVSFEQTVKAVLAKVLLGEADVGIVYSSDIGPDEAGQVTQITIPDHLNTIATYPVAVVEDSQQPALAQAFIDYLLSEEGQVALQAHGFLAVE